MQFKLKKPCANCPFLKEGGVPLRPGRLEGIVEELHDDHSHFLCHKTVHNNRTGGEWDDDDDGDHRYQASGMESQCVGSMIYLLKEGRQNVSMRLAAAFGMVDFDELQAQADKVIDPIGRTV